MSFSTPSSCRVAGPARLLILAVLVAFATAPTPSRAAERTRVAVMEIAAERAFDLGLNRLLNELLLTELSENYDVVGKSDIASMLGFEQQKQMLGCGDEGSCLAEIGGALGVPYILTGNIGKVGKSFHINLKVFEASKSKIISRVSENAGETEELLVPALQKALAKLMSKVPGPGQKSSTPKVAAPTPVPAAPPVAAPAPVVAVAPSAPSPAESVAVKPAAPKPSSLAPAASGAVKTSSHLASWIGIGVGVAALGAGAFYTTRVVQARDDYVVARATPQEDGSHLTAMASAESRYEKNAFVANLLVGGGAVVGLTAVLYRIFGEGDPSSGTGGDAPALVVMPTGSGLNVSGSF